MDHKDQFVTFTPTGMTPLALLGVRSKVTHACTLARTHTHTKHTHHTHSGVTHTNHTLAHSHTLHNRTTRTLMQGEVGSAIMQALFPTSPPQGGSAATAADAAVETAQGGQDAAAQGGGRVRKRKREDQDGQPGAATTQTPSDNEIKLAVQMHWGDVAAIVVPGVAKLMSETESKGRLAALQVAA